MKSSFRISILVVIFIVTGLIIISRLFHWQIIAASQLAALAASQRQSVAELPPVRGNILASDGFPLAINKEGYLLYANPQELKQDPKILSQMLAPLLASNLDEVKIATDASSEDIEKIQKNLLSDTQDFIDRQLSQENLVWVLLKRKISQKTKEAIDHLNIKGLAYEPEPIRSYPEASMSAQILGFLGQDEFGKDTGYFGLEGYYNLDLLGRMGIVKQEKDAINRPIPIGKFWQQKKRDGRHLQLYLDRSIQYLVEESLKKAVESYGAKSGSVVIMDPKTGGILAMASWPSFDPNHYSKYDQELFVNPIVSSSYEPGSTFKVLTMSAGIDTDTIKPDTVCEICDGPFKIDQYYIRTWNDKYYPGSNMTEVLAHSDNVGMVYLAQKLGVDTFVDYITRFGIGEPTGIDLQGEIAPSLRDEWKEVDLYTAAFGQGLVVTGMQMVRAIAAVANGGQLMQPRMVKTVIDSDQEKAVEPVVVRQVISPETAKTVTEMMVAAVDYGDAKWARPKGYRIAGKTGTAQVSVAGHYDEEKTIASFVGFAPADDPAFVMLTIIEEPTSSPWGSETAAPLFFTIAKKLFVYMGIPADN
ncbi:penicillin-binding protein 2 [Candidatus Beckwithbacteria bacterium]|nr:penicillin-binding protein 2 [Candidatus Beckwithbacteria bacterium]